MARSLAEVRSGTTMAQAWRARQRTCMSSGPLRALYLPGTRASRRASSDGSIFVDLGSPDLFNMRYAQAADLYLGDMSSQLYEFIARPRPVAFINAHGVAWRDNPRYAGWHLGEVAEGAGDVMEIIDRAFANHSSKVLRQEQAVMHAFGEYRGATARAADILMEYLQCAA
jgi:hypothetical protein